MYACIRIVAYETYAAHNVQIYIISQREFMPAESVIHRGI